MIQTIWHNFIGDMRAIGISPWRFIFFKTARVSLAVRARVHGGGVVSLLAKIYLYRHLIEVGRDVRFGKGLKMPHPKNIIIANTAIIGDDVQINQGVTIGGNFKKSRLVCGQTRKIAIIGNRVTICPNAVIGGPVVIGDSVVVGANSVVTKDVPENSIVFGQNQIKRIESETGVQDYLRKKDYTYCANDKTGQ